ncbi:helix-turn-helix domain-containing protein [Limosilactobacillus mucosae]|jgi:excisionase family DNA binding protein|uniref:helix-turn-helix domain-containing protein n=1 Tax=Limosilactobacillus mucosae TaxID=97478 RepID=UPI001F590BDF|nr:helix-turn-helix domain-containing protein [Limosilactobacillus mucosae]MCI1490140.1 helix-turn-helix domain-containing protein [Limosilactobacillus mucosae]UNL61141.1 helix-turn-helix domain-containing protein [Limosilactobacillus mucosae]
MPEYMRLKDAMNYLGISNYSTLREYIAAGLPTIQVGRSKRISKTAIDKFMAEHQSQVKGVK